MIESDDIEFLDEDADIVQKCVKVKPLQYAPSPDFMLIKEESDNALLVERPVGGKKKKRKKVAEDDSDYDPTEDLYPHSPPSPTQKPKKRKHYVFNKKVKIYQKDVVTNVKVAKKAPAPSPKEVILERKTMDIKIPDYEDPLCLPVKAIKQDNTDVKRLHNWNNVCLEHIKHCDNMLKPEKGETNGSTRTFVFRNVVNKELGKPETTIWSKTCVENIDGDRKSEIFQGVLPRYKESNTVTSFSLLNRKTKKSYQVTNDVVLNKEVHKEGEVLVVYKPKESLSAVYKLAVEEIKPSKPSEKKQEKDNKEPKMHLKELLCCKMCTPCYQTSWRGATHNKKRPLPCPICKRSSFVTAYNLLSHLRNHSSEDVRKFKNTISKILAEVVAYNYKCRACCQRFDSIKQLRLHLKTHQGKELFTCEVGNHAAK